jgi:DNA-binding SARP family transcriptional activator
MSRKYIVVFVFFVLAIILPKAVLSNVDSVLINENKTFERFVHDSLAIEVKLSVTQPVGSYYSTFLNILNTNDALLYSFIIDYTEGSRASLVFISSNLLNRIELDSVSNWKAGDTLYWSVLLNSRGKTVLEYMGKRTEVDGINIQNNQAYIFSVFPNQDRNDALKIISIKIDEMTAQRNNYIGIIILVAFIVLDILAFVYFHLKRKKKNREQPPPPVPTLASVSVDHTISNISIIRTLGGFKVYNKLGNEISKSFSPMQKELLLLLLLNSEKGGISSQSLRSILWFDKTEQSSNSNRGVYFSKLRSLLNDSVGKCEIVGQSGSWLFKSEKIKVDYFMLNELLQKKDITRDGIEELLAITVDGNLLPESDYEWLDKFKSDTTDRYTTFISDILTNLQVKDEPQLCIKVADSIFRFDPVNELALKYKCIAYNVLGKRYLSTQLYQSFAREYKQFYGEEYKVTLAELIAEPDNVKSIG